MNLTVIKERGVDLSKRLDEMLLWTDAEAEKFEEKVDRAGKDFLINKALCYVRKKKLGQKPVPIWDDVYCRIAAGLLLPEFVDRMGFSDAKKYRKWSCADQLSVVADEALPVIEFKGADIQRKADGLPDFSSRQPSEFSSLERDVVFAPNGLRGSAEQIARVKELAFKHEIQHAPKNTVELHAVKGKGVMFNGVLILKAELCRVLGEV